MSVCHETNHARLIHDKLAGECHGGRRAGGVIAIIDGMPHVFISYSGSDLMAAQALKHLLHTKGWKAWIERHELKPGENFPGRITDELRDSVAVVTIWSASSLDSAWVHHETSYAITAGKHVALRLDGFDPNKLPGPLRPHHCSELTKIQADPAPLIKRLEDLATQPQPTDGGDWIDVSRMPTTYADKLFGREGELTELHRAWASNGADKTNIVVLDAMGGIGKTALVHHFIDSMRRQDWCGATAVFVWSFYSQGAEERSRGSAEPFLNTALKRFGHDGSTLPTQHDKGVKLAELVAGRRTLLVLDGLEPLQFPAGRRSGGTGESGLTGSLKQAGLSALFKQLAVRNPGLLVVTTRLRIPELKGFRDPVVIRHSLERIAAAPAIELLQSLGVKGSRRQLKNAVEDFRGHALALSSLGRYLVVHYDGDVRRRDTVPLMPEYELRQERDPFRVMNAYEVLLRRQIAERKDKSGRAEATAAAKQLTLLYLIGLFDRPIERAALDAVLAPPAIPVLTADVVGVTPRQWDTAAMALRDLGLLARKSDGAPNILDAHPLIREFFGMRLRTQYPAAWREAHRRLWRYHDVESARDPNSLDELLLVGHAVAHAALAGNSVSAYKLYDKKIRRKIKPHGFYDLDISILLNFFEEPWRRMAPELPENLQAQALDSAWSSLRSSGRLAEAAEAAEHTCRVLRQQGKWSRYVDRKVELIQIQIKLGLLPQAIQEAIEALALANKHGMTWQEADIYCFLGQAYHMAGKIPDAEAAFKQSVKAAGHDKNPRAVSVREFVMSEFYLDIGRHRVVEKYVNRAIDLVMDMGSGRAVRAFALGNLALGRLKLHDAQTAAEKAPQYTSAAMHIQTALNDLRNHNLIEDLPHALIMRASHRRLTGKFDWAYKDLREAIDIADHCAMRLSYVDACVEAARLQLAGGPRVFEDPRYDYLAQATATVHATGYERRRAELEQLRHDPLLNQAAPKTRRGFPRRRNQTPPGVG
jgi:tetratricopeptide (TPR) repeat protein